MSKKKKDQLGINPSTASARLKKNLMYQMAEELNRLNCYRCNKPIETVEEFSVEHKIAWLDSEDPKGLFFDLKNIAFSHLKCNRDAGRNGGQRYFTEEDKTAANKRNLKNWYKSKQSEEYKRKRREAYQRGKPW